MLFGSLLIVLTMIVGAMSGYVSNRDLLLFLILVAYVYSAAILAFWFGFRPSRPKGIVLAILLIPAISLHSAATLEELGKKRAARTYATSSDQEAIDRARAELLEIGRRSGNQGHVRVLLKHLKAAETDEERVRLVEILGQLSYKYEPLLRELRRLREETRGQSERTKLHQSVELAILEVNPYEDRPPGS